MLALGAALAAPLMEIYGCTEAGQVASRRPTAGIEWHTYDGLRLSGDGAETSVQGGHVPQATPLADVIEVIDATTFRLLGRSNDLINIAGKRSSLGHLNYHLNMIPGVQDGAFWLPPDDAAGGVVRLIAFVVAPELTPQALHDTVIKAQVPMAELLTYGAQLRSINDNLNHVTVAHFADRPSCQRLGRDVANTGPSRNSAEASIGNDRDVLAVVQSLQR